MKSTMGIKLEVITPEYNDLVFHTTVSRDKPYSFEEFLEFINETVEVETESAYESIESAYVELSEHEITEETEFLSLKFTSNFGNKTYVHGVGFTDSALLGMVDGQHRENIYKYGTENIVNRIMAKEMLNTPANGCPI